VIVLNTSQLSNDVKYVSERCREFRKKANKSQYDLSDITGLSPNTIARLENDQRIPDLEQIFRYCYALNVPVTDFLPLGVQSLGSTNKSIPLRAAYSRLSEANKEFALNAMSALVDGLLAQQFSKQ
jgi:transcriptional regulator with XRE-family HTH domain